MPSERVNEATRREWRELGFFYALDDKAKRWTVEGSRDGLLKFASIIAIYSGNPKNQELSEHDHFGPYMYLKIGTWEKPTIDQNWIAGTLGDLKGLANLIVSEVSKLDNDQAIGLRGKYAPDEPYELLLELKDDDFDPASADEACWP